MTKVLESIFVSGFENGAVTISHTNAARKRRERCNGFSNFLHPNIVFLFLIVIDIDIDKYNFYRAKFSILAHEIRHSTQQNDNNGS